MGESLREVQEKSDALGWKHHVFVQMHRGVPVFGGVVRTHFDEAGDLAAVTGTTVPFIAVDATPSVSADGARGTALAAVFKGSPASGLNATRATLYVYRTGLAQGVNGENHQRRPVPEGNSGSSDAVFTISLSHAYALPVTVEVRLKDGTAGFGSDYIVPNFDEEVATVRIPPLTLSKEFTVKVRGDRRREADETFFVVLHSPRNAVIGDGSGTGTILNDDGPATTTTAAGESGMQK